MTKRNPEGRGVQSIEVGGRLLAAMVTFGKPAMLRDLAALANVTPAQAHAYLVSFRKIGLIEQDPVGGRYFLGPFALRLGLTRMRQHVPLKIAGQAAIDLAAETGMMVTIAVWGTHGPTIIQVQESVQPIHVNLRAGAVYTVTGTATGRLFAAMLPDELVRPFIEEEMSAGPQDRRIGVARSDKAFAADMAEIRRRGYATTEGVPVPGINAVSVPVRDHSGQVQFAITVIGPAPALKVGGDDVQAEFVAGFARRLSEDLGYRFADEPVESPFAAPLVAFSRKAPGTAAPRRARQPRKA